MKEKQNINKRNIYLLAVVIIFGLIIMALAYFLLVS